MNTPKCWFGQMYEEDKYAKQRILTYAKLITPYLKRGSRLLDIGCYTAELYEHLPKDIEYCGLDFDEEALKIAMSKGVMVKKVRFDEEPINLNTKFDVIVAAEIIEHLKNPEALLEQAKRLLSEDGLILVSLPNECTIYHRIMALFGKGIDMYAFKLYKHLHLPTISQSRNFIKGYFGIIKEVYYVSASGKGSRWECLGKFTSRIPDRVWLGLAKIWPGLFARGAIFLCRHKNAHH